MCVTAQLTFDDRVRHCTYDACTTSTPLRWRCLHKVYLIAWSTIAQRLRHCTVDSAGVRNCTVDPCTGTALHDWSLQNVHAFARLILAQRRRFCTLDPCTTSMLLHAWSLQKNGYAVPRLTLSTVNVPRQSSSFHSLQIRPAFHSASVSGGAVLVNWPVYIDVKNSTSWDGNMVQVQTVAWCYLPEHTEPKLWWHKLSTWSKWW